MVDQLGNRSRALLLHAPGAVMPAHCSFQARGGSGGLGMRSLRCRRSCVNREASPMLPGAVSGGYDACANPAPESCFRRASSSRYLHRHCGRHHVLCKRSSQSLVSLPSAGSRASAPPTRYVNSSAPTPWSRPNPRLPHRPTAVARWFSHVSGEPRMLLTRTLARAQRFLYGADATRFLARIRELLQTR